MAKTAVITARVEPELKEEVEAVLSELGLSTSQAILLYFKQIAMQQGIPFLIKIPTQETLAAIEESQNPQKLPAFDDVDALFDDLEA